MAAWHGPSSADASAALQESAVFSATDEALKDDCLLVDKVKHPLLDKVKACSTDPVKAADFFLSMLHPLDIRRRPNIAYHPYLKPTYLRMLDEFPLPESHPYRRAPVKACIAEGSVQQPGGFSLDFLLLLQYCCAFGRL